MNPLAYYVRIAMVLVVIVALVGIYLRGHSDGYDKAEVKYKLQISEMQAAAVEEKEQAKQAMLIEISNASQRLENDRAKSRIVYINRAENAAKIEAANPIYLGACFDDDGLRLANAALGNFPINPALSAQPSSTMPRVITPQ